MLSNSLASYKPVRSIAIGKGHIGASWAAKYLARAVDVVATDPGLNAEANVRRYVDHAWKKARHSILVLNADHRSRS